MSSAREHFLYGALVGAGAVALGTGAFLATFGLWRRSTRRQVTISFQLHSAREIIIHFCRMGTPDTTLMAVSATVTTTTITPTRDGATTICSRRS